MSDANDKALPIVLQTPFDKTREICHSFWVERKTSQSKAAMRCVTATLLPLWLVALVICWFHCASEACAPSPGLTSSGAESCHATKSCHKSSEKSSEKQTGCAECFAQAEFTGSVLSLDLQKPADLLIYSVSPLSEFASKPLLSSAQSRQIETEFIHVSPVVCLGPAHRSQAPPVCS